MYDWYSELLKPPFMPPAHIFSPVWTLLYLMMFTALLIFILTKSNEDKSWGYFVFFIQFVINLCWTPVFFLIKSPPAAFAVIIVLDILVLMNIIAFFKVSKLSGVILVPYFIWIIFASYLNVGIILFN